MAAARFIAVALYPERLDQFGYVYFRKRSQALISCNLSTYLFISPDLDLSVLFPVYRCY